MGDVVLSFDQVDAELSSRGLLWARRGSELEKVAHCKGFGGAMAFVNALGDLAEAMNHHPDIDIRFNTVTLHLFNHAAGGISEKDLSLAAQIDQIAIDT